MTRPLLPTEGLTPRERGNRLAARARILALNELARCHPGEFSVLLHAEKHGLGITHKHGPENPETISTWGEG